MADDRKRDRRGGGSPPANRHDALFRAILENQERATALIREYLPPDIRRLISDDPPQLVDGTFVSEAMRASQSDRLFKVKLKDGGAAYLFCLLEHKSRPDPRTPLQLLDYTVRIWDRYAGNRADRLRRLPPVIPLVIYHGRAPWTVPLSIFDMIADTDELRPFIRSMQYEVGDLGRIETDQLSANGTLRAGLAALKFAFSRISRAELQQLLAALRTRTALKSP